MNADILVDRVHKYYWCKVPKNELKNTAIQMAFQKTFTLYTWLQLFMMMMILVVMMPAMTTVIGAAGAEGGVHLVDLAAPLRSPVRRREAQDRPAAHIPQVSTCCQELALKQELMKCWLCKKGVGVRIRTVTYRT